MDQRLREEGIRNHVSLIAGGSIRSSVDVVKAIALGADACYIGTAALLALGCHLCRSCQTGLCNWGITTQRPELVKRLDIDEGSRRLVNLMTAWRHEIKEMMDGMGINSVAAQNGLCASFSPKPLADWDGNGMHINVSARCDEKAQPLPGVIAGILENIRDMTLFMNPCEESYDRLGHDKAPLYVTWSAENRSQLIRIPAAVGEYRRAELRSADPMTNPYIAYALMIYAGLHGLAHDLQLCPASDFNVYTAPAEVLDGLKKLPGSLAEAAALAEASAFIRKHLPEAVISAYCHQ